MKDPTEKRFFELCDMEPQLIRLLDYVKSLTPEDVPFWCEWYSFEFKPWLSSIVGELSFSNNEELMTQEAYSVALGYIMRHAPAEMNA